MPEDKPKYLFCVQHNDPQFNPMSLSIARTWLDDKGIDIAFYFMYHAGNIMRQDNVEANPDIQDHVDYLLSRGVPIYICGTCSRVCQLNASNLYPGVQVANRHIFYALMTERRVVYY